MYVLVLMVFMQYTVAIDHVGPYTQAECYEAAEQFEIGASPAIAKHRDHGAVVTRIGLCVRAPKN